MSKSSMTLQEFADQHGLQVKNFVIQGPRGEISRGHGGWFYFRRGIGYVRFYPATRAKEAVEAIGFQYQPPPKRDRKAFLIVKKVDGWYVADKAGPFKTRDLARVARMKIKEH